MQPGTAEVLLYFVVPLAVVSLAMLYALVRMVLAFRGA